jgi:uncharacterized protein YbbC (DUF1343 family)
MIRTGLDVLAADRFAALRGKSVGLVCHPASVDSQFRHAIDLIAAAPGVRLAAVFGPEHGLLGQAQDLVHVSEEESRHGAAPAIRLVSLYGPTAASLRPTRESLAGLDTLVIDLQDVGSRYYTFQATMMFALEAALPLGIDVLVLDRPNPLGGGDVEGPRLRPGFESFVGAHDLAVRHGLTLGELARMFFKERRLDGGGTLDVVRCDGWRRTMRFEDTGLPWVLPSPNMPTPDTATVYPGQCLIEGTRLSEGRGTTRPFEICGAPGIDARTLAAQLNDQRHPGVAFRPVWFRPTFQKFAGQDCGGVQLHVTDRHRFRPLRTSLALLLAMRHQLGDRFAWRTEIYEFVTHPIAIDLLFGGDRERRGIEAGLDWTQIARTWEPEEEAFSRRRQEFLLYG